MDGLCACCGASLSVMKRCSRCRDVVYCSKDCQEKHWLGHKQRCESYVTSPAHEPNKERRDVQSGNDESCRIDEEPQAASSILIKIKCQRAKHELNIPKNANGEEAFVLIGNQVKIPPENIKLVSKGKLVTKENILSFLENKAIFQAFGEEAEDEAGLDARDIHVLMAQLSVERNVAVKALRKTGDLIDAILYVSENI